MDGTLKQVYKAFIKASPDQVWQAITDPAFTRRYFGGHIETPLQTGGPYRSVSADGHTLVTGEFLKVDPPLRLAHTWRAVWSAEMSEDPPSRVTWEIELAGSAVTKLTIVHDQFPGETATYKDVADGWIYVLSGLKTLLETGEPLFAEGGQ